jgi:hypothetical protein
MELKDPVFEPKVQESLPKYLLHDRDHFERSRLMGYMRCYDCEGEVPLDQADSFMCRKVHQTITKLSNKGWTDKEILMECKRIFGNEILYKHYEAPPPIIVIYIQSYKLLFLAWAGYMLRAKYFRVRWEKLVKYRKDRYY